MVGAILQQADAVEIAGDRLLIRFDAGTEALVRRLEQPANLDVVRRAASDAAGRRIDVRVETGARKAAAARDEPPPPGDPGPAHDGDQASLMERARKEPGVRKLLREFGAQIVDIKPL